jgi:hypothetical protein
MEVPNAQVQPPTYKKPSRDATVQVLRDFLVTYADVIAPNRTPERWDLTERVRRLTWKSKHRITLADAVWCYGQIAVGYNEFQPAMLTELHRAFPDEDIQVTPARELSVAIYLHVPNRNDLWKRIETFVNEHFNADEVKWVTSDTLRCWWD